MKVWKCWNNHGYFWGYTVMSTGAEALAAVGLSEGVAQEVPDACPVWGGYCEKNGGHCCGPDSNAWALMEQGLSQGCGYQRS